MVATCHKCGGKHVATMWQTATNVVANSCYLYPSKSPSTTGLTTNVGPDFPYALSRKMPFRFARGIFFLKHGIGRCPNLCNWGTSYYARKRKKDTLRDTKKDLFLSIAGCAVDQKFVSIDLDIAHCFDFTCRFFAGDFFVRMSWGKFS